MGLSGLNIALSGLNVAKQQINVISNNVANASTPGYTRKILPQNAQSIQGVGVGVASELVVRSVDLNLTRDLWTQVSATGRLDIQESYLDRIVQFHGPPDRELSVAAELARLQDSFAALADTPENTFLLAAVVEEASDTAAKVNGLAQLIDTLRNDVQGEIQQTVEQINGLLSEIKNLNDQVAINQNSGRSTAEIKDQRDSAIQELAGLIDISFFVRGDGVMVVQTNRGEELVSDVVRPLSFASAPISATSYYPDSINGIIITPPSNNVNGVDITALSPGGKLGGLIELRDVTFPTQTAQIDELAHKLALRFEAQGLRLFTDASGRVPLDTAPDPTTVPPTPVTYVGFAAEMRVNQSILQDNSLIRTGTTGLTVPAGSNEVIARVLEYTFGSVNYQEAIGGIDMRTSLQAAPNDTLQNWLGLYSENNVSSSVDLTAYAGVADILTAGGVDAFGVTASSETDRFTITFDDPDIGTGPHVVEIDLRTVVPSGVNAAQDLVNAITADADWATIVAEFGASVSVNASGELSIDSRSDVTIAAAGAEPMSNLGFAFLGLNPGTSEATDPYFDIKVGTNPLTRITIEPADDETDLYAKLSAVPGLAVEDFTASVDGFLRMRPGEDYASPDYGGSLTIIGGPFQASGAGINAVVGAGTVPDTINIASALFGSFSAGPPVADASPIVDVGYASETNASLTPPIPTVSMRSDLLGPGADISTTIIGAMKLVDYAQKIVNADSQRLINVQSRLADEESLREVLQTQLTNQSGVNIDEELGNLIVVQTAFAASARVVTAVDEMFQELLNAVR